MCHPQVTRLSYHIFNRLSRTFFKFFEKLFEVVRPFVGPPEGLALKRLHIIAPLPVNVKHFFEVFSVFLSFSLNRSYIVSGCSSRHNIWFSVFVPALEPTGKELLYPILPNFRPDLISFPARFYTFYQISAPVFLYPGKADWIDIYFVSGYYNVIISEYHGIVRFIVS